MATDDTLPTTLTARRRIVAQADQAQADQAQADQAQADQAQADPTEEPAVDVYADVRSTEPTILITPDNCAPVTLGGVDYAADENGHVSVPVEFVDVLLSHGFSRV